MTKPQPALSELVRAKRCGTTKSTVVTPVMMRAFKILRQQLGLLTSFAVVGPFDNDGRKGQLRSRIRPRAGRDRAEWLAALSGKSPALPVSWRVIPEAQVASDGAIPLDAWLRPETEGTAYAQTSVNSRASKRWRCESAQPAQSRCLSTKARR